MRLSHWDDLPQTSEDITRKFGGTYVEVSGVQFGDQIVFLDRFEREVCRASYLQNGATARVETLWGELNVQRAFPDVVGAVPYRNGVLFHKKTAARQWSVGAGPGTGILWDHNFKNVDWDLEKAHALYYPAYEHISVHDAVKKFEEKKLGLMAFALSSIYWLARREDKIVLYRNRNKMGSFVYGGFFRHGAAKEFDVELWDDLRLRV